MEKTIQLGQVQPSILSKVESFVENWKAWYDAKSETFTAMCATDDGEVFTHADVIKAHLVLGLVLALIGIGGAL